MAEDFTKEIEAKLAELPEDVQEAILSNNWEQKVAAIAQAHHLHIDQTEKLGSETLMLMLGFTDANNFPSNLVNEVGISKEEADKIAGEVNSQILLSIRESMKTGPAASTTVSTPEKSVVMPSAATAAPKPTVSPPSISSTPAASASSTPTPAVPKPTMPVKPPEMHPAEVMLTEKTVQVAPPPVQPPKPEAPKPAAYKTDPYREPPE
ncbi:MAG TPA: hypothetical protein VHD31_00515 [Candidatus Paceibacterota bacterium]|nr:hypothetical protein [Candidatus Paceibacterota bacterium]